MNARRSHTPRRFLRWPLGSLGASLAFGVSAATAQPAQAQPAQAQPAQAQPAQAQPAQAQPPAAPPPTARPAPAPGAPAPAPGGPVSPREGENPPDSGWATAPSSPPEANSVPPPVEPGASQTSADGAPPADHPPPDAGPTGAPPHYVPGPPFHGGYGFPPPPYGYPPYGYPPPPDCAADPRPATLPYREGRPAPPGYYYEERMRRGPIIAGAILLGVPYALGLSFAGGDSFSNQTGWLALPVAGPWITLAARERCDETQVYDHDILASPCSEERTVRTLLVVDALMQATGTALLLWGTLSKTKEYVRDDVSVQLVPTQLGRSGYGLGAVGSF
ncbi:MAG: hypothetical protein GX607_06505 [Myxococcales bacterium]|nr:hypothetical protein [Myxococcales bacterium]